MSPRLLLPSLPILVSLVALLAACQPGEDGPMRPSIEEAAESSPTAEVEEDGLGADESEEAPRRPAIEEAAEVSPAETE